MESMDLLFGLIGLAMGVYVLYASYMMQKTGEINPTLLLDKDTKPVMCKDKEAYLKKVMPCMWILGIAAVLYGGVMLVNSYFIAIPILSLIAIAVFFVVLIWYAYVTMQAKKKYF